MLLMLLIMVSIHLWALEPLTVSGDSMLPTLHSGERILGSKLSTPKAGDIVTFKNPLGTVPNSFIKRVIAVGGQQVEIRDGRVFVDRTALDEPYLEGQTTDIFADSRIKLPVKLAAGQLWLMGDNRSVSRDSRWFGPVDEKDVFSVDVMSY